MKTPALFLAFLAAALLAAAAPPAEDRPAATVAGEPIPLAAVDDVVKSQLMEIRAREHQLRSQALDALIAQSLLEKEAKARGVSEDALEKTEVLDKAAVGDDEARAYYEANKARIGSMPEEEAMKQIRAGLAQQRQGERRAAFARELRSKYDVKVLLEPYRIPVALGDAPVRGSAMAPVTILEFSDFQCPYCVRSRPTVARIRETYGDKVRWAFRHFPLSFHDKAEKAGEAAACAGDQGRFWEMHDRLWANSAKLGLADLKQHAVALGLDAAKFDQCLDSGQHAGLLERDEEAGQGYGVSGTPAFFVNGRPLVGAQPFEAFQQVIDDELARAGAAGPAAAAASK
jgi:predicted DsbA family dithiol-disulfide isomerase